MFLSDGAIHDPGARGNLADTLPQPGRL